MSEDEPSALQCASCGDPLPRDRPGGLCPRCLMGGLLDEGATGEVTSVQADASLGAALPSDEASSPGEDPLEGMQIGRYKLLQRIGEGGFGLVYMAEQVRSVNRRVALKIIKAGMDSKQVIARFEAERQALAMMDHRCIARVFDVGETEEGRPYFVMELVKGIPLTTYCQEENLDTEARLRLFMQVCGAVQHAHLKGVIHRDLKPSNILVTLHDGEAVPKVIDFGIAKAMDQRLTDKTLFTRFEQMIGTPAYMSPEQAALSGLDVDTRSDVYALGVLLYELLTGTTPHDAETLRQAAFDEMRRLIREEDPPKPSTRMTDLRNRQRTQDLPPKMSQAHIPRDLDWIAMKALEKDRGRRYETAAGLAEDVERFLSQEPVSAGPPGVRYKLRKFVARNRAAVAAAALVVVSLVVGVAVSTYGMWEARRAREEARVQAQLANENAERAQAASEQAAAAETKAREEAEISKAVSEFLQKDLLWQASPEATANREITLREVLDRAAGKVGERFKDQPLVEAEVRMTLAETYRDLVLIGEARVQAHAAMQLFESLLLPNDPQLMRAQSEYGHLCFGEWDDDEDKKLEQEAKDLLRSVIDRQSSTLGLQHPDTLRSMWILAEKLPPRAERDQILARFPEASVVNDPRAREIILNVKLLIATSVADADQVASMAEKALGDLHTLTFKAKRNYALELSAAKEWALAEPVWRDLVEQVDEVYADDSNSYDPYYFPVYHAEALFYLDRKDESREVLLAHYESKWCEGSPLDNPLRWHVLVALMFAHDLDNWLPVHQSLVRRTQEKLLEPSEAAASVEVAGGLNYFTYYLSWLLFREVEGRWGFPKKSVTSLEGEWGEQRKRSFDRLKKLRLDCLDRSNRILVRLKNEGKLDWGGSGHSYLANNYFFIAFDYHRSSTPDEVEIKRTAEAFAKTLEMRFEKFHDGETDHQTPPVKYYKELLMEIDGGTPYKFAQSISNGIVDSGCEISFLKEFFSRNSVLQAHSLAILQLMVELIVVDRQDHQAARRLVDAACDYALALSREPNDVKSLESLRNELYDFIEFPVRRLGYKGFVALPEEVEEIVSGEAVWSYCFPGSADEPPEISRFVLTDFDDSNWRRGSDGTGELIGFGYPDAANPVDPPPMGQRGTAYFRHRFTVDRSYEKVWLSGDYWDGIVVYLDGKEVRRLDIAAGAEVHPDLKAAYEITTKSVKITRLRLDQLEPGEHVIAITLHPASSYNETHYIGNLRLHGLPVESPDGAAE